MKTRFPPQTFMRKKHRENPCWNDTRFYSLSAPCSYRVHKTKVFKTKTPLRDCTRVSPPAEVPRADSARRQPVGCHRKPAFAPLFLIAPASSARKRLPVEAFHMEERANTFWFCCASLPRNTPSVFCRVWNVTLHKCSYSQIKRGGQ